MIAIPNYFGLYDAIVSAKGVVQEVNGEQVLSGPVQETVDGWTLDKSKAAKCAQVSALALSLRAKAMKGTDPWEATSWPAKLAEAKLFESDPDGCPMLTAEASRRGVPLADLVARVFTNADAFQALEAAIAGTDGKHRDSVNACTTYEEVAAYDFSAGWGV